MEKLTLNPATPVYSRPEPTSLSSTLAKTEESPQVFPEFRELLTLMLLTSLSSGGKAEAGMSGLSINEIMAPLMLTLMERLMANQVEAEATPEVNTLVANPKPKGMPIDGYLTQGSHAGHVALDFGAPVGTPVHATMDGKVVYAGWNDEGYGNLVIVENGAYRTYYAHLSKIPVKVGQKIQAGTVIGLSGNTGNSTGPHLHYEIRLNGKTINPTSVTLA